MPQKPENIPPPPSFESNKPNNAKDEEKFKSEMQSDDNNETKVDPNLYPFAIYFMKHWGWNAKQAIQADKQFFNTFMHQCQEILNRNAQIFKALDPTKEDENQ